MMTSRHMLGIGLGRRSLQPCRLLCHPGGCGLASMAPNVGTRMNDTPPGRGPARCHLMHSRDGARPPRSIRRWEWWPPLRRCCRRRLRAPAAPYSVQLGEPARASGLVTMAAPDTAVDMGVVVDIDFRRRLHYGELHERHLT
jgi:hypothetical protein